MSDDEHIDKLAMPKSTVDAMSKADGPTPR
jgi:hypothetical protein